MYGNVDWSGAAARVYHCPAPADGRREADGAINHTDAQVILAEKDRGRYQEKGSALADFGEGQAVYLKAGVVHWHGAAPDQGIDQRSMYAGDLKWLDKVTDDEYFGRAR